uniref:Uncharacterized protein n=1 Tax=Rhizophora mucronata TaxID=61149 RepID=A0A2P2QN29_RHIMU
MGQQEQSCLLTLVLVYLLKKKMFYRIICPGTQVLSDLMIRQQIKWDLN